MSETVKFNYPYAPSSGLSGILIFNKVSEPNGPKGIWPNKLSAIIKVLMFVIQVDPSTYHQEKEKEEKHALNIVSYFAEMNINRANHFEGWSYTELTCDYLKPITKQIWLLKQIGIYNQMFIKVGLTSKHRDYRKWKPSFEKSVLLIKYRCLHALPIPNFSSKV